MGSEDYQVLDRLETRSGRLCDSISNGDKPESRRNAMNFLKTLNARTDKSNMSRIDIYNMEQMFSESGEWSPPSKKR